MMIHEVIMAGFGGQGIMFMGRILATAGMIDGKEVTWFPSYGAEIRGGTANCTVMISDKAIGSPIVSEPWAVIAMNQPSVKKFGCTLIDIRIRGFSPADAQTHHAVAIDGLRDTCCCILLVQGA